MINISGKLVTLQEATEKDLDKLYYWKYEEEEQAAKKWNGPYIPEPKISKMEFKQDWEMSKEIFPQIPSALTIHVNKKLIGIVSC